MSCPECVAFAVVLLGQLEETLADYSSVAINAKNLSSHNV